MNSVSERLDAMQRSHLENNHIKKMLLYFQIAVIKGSFEFNQTAVVSID